MKKLILLFSIIILFSSCNTNPDYAKNLATAQKLFELHGEEDIDAQLALVSQDIESNTSMYKSETVGYDQYVAMLKGYHAAFDNINYTAENWLPGTNEDGQLDGSVRTYGTWSGTNVVTGKELDLKGYWYMNFDADGKIIAQGDFFDFGGMYDAVYPKTKIFAKIDVKKGKAQDMLDALNSENGLPATRAYDGCNSAEMVFNEETNSVWVISDWVSNDHYLKYLEWRMNDDDFVPTKMIPLMLGGENGLSIAHTNSNYTIF
jgi:quinol monooxygenase YgiN/ketosteroid isomerase-like protein